MDLVCAWCGAALGPTAAPTPDEPRQVSHGICEPCLRGMLRHRSRPLAELLEEFAAPVLAVGGDSRVRAVNRRAAVLIGKEPAEVSGLLGGDAFDCRHARLPGGCGETVHCRTCAVRNTVAETLRTGEARRRVPAYADLHHITGDRRVRFLISTCLVDGTVLLRIDEAADVPPAASPAKGRARPPADGDTP